VNNPFDVQTPENLTTDAMVGLFVHENTDYNQIAKAGHSLITGPRGAGKSMFFRFMEPDCQCAEHKKTLKDLTFYAAYVPVKETDLNLPELFRLQESKHAGIVLNEHVLTTHIATKIFVSLRERIQNSMWPDDAGAQFRSLYQDTLFNLLGRCGWNGAAPDLNAVQTPAEIFGRIIDIFDDVFSQISSYTRGLAFRREVSPYDGPLFGFSDFLVPLVKAIMALGCMPSGPMFLLIDDADNLSPEQTMILNSWVARRTTAYLCIKISAQEGEYKTYLAVNGQRIDSPHDYSEFNIADKYTTGSDNYLERVSAIIVRRLQRASIDAGPSKFFPEDTKQEEEIRKIGEQLRADWEKSGRGNRASDDVTRYARPDFIKSLSEDGKKSGSTYSYAGFQQIVHLSSGIVRHLLETSSLMFAETASATGSNPVTAIPPNIQDRVLRDYSDRLLFTEFEKLEQEEVSGLGQATFTGQPDTLSNATKLRNLINALGGMFRSILVSDSSERRVFSIAFSNGPDEEVAAVLQLGVKYGYLHRSTIGNKEGTGRVPLYILTRRLAPSFKLDPTSFAGYKFVTNQAIKETLYSPKRLINLVKIKGFDEVMLEPDQKSLFDE
jgi:hypothetical protein